MQIQPDSPFAPVVGLGPLKADHPYKSAGKWFGLVFGLVCLAAAPALGLLAVYLGYDAYSQHGLRRVDDAILAPLCFAGAALALGLILVYNAWRNWPLAAALYENGFAYNDRKGLKQLRWDQIDCVWQKVTRHYTNGVYTGTTHVYTVLGQDGSRVVLDDRLVQVEGLGQAIQAGASKVLWPKYAESIQAGQRVNFGPLALDANGLYAGQKALRWDEIKAVKIEQGTVALKKEGGWLNWASATVPQIPNFFIFYELIGKFTKVE